MFLGRSECRWLSVEDAARMLRMNPHTIYRNLSDVPHVRLGTYIRIPCEWLYLEPPLIPTLEGRRKPPEWYEQPYLPFDVVPERRWRNSGRRVVLNHFGEPVDALANF